jgi:cytochrome c peroxidase
MGQTFKAIGVLRSLCVCMVVAGGLSAGAQPSIAKLDPVNFPPENPFSEEKRVLGKILFWDEQLSSDNTTSCGTCHIPAAGGVDPRIANNPGLDGQQNTLDDIRGSFGIVKSDANDDFAVDATFDLMRQITGRSANSVINSAFADELFWDGRATSEFIDPETGAVAIASGGALESQVAGPPVNDVEMAHVAREWSQITSKLQSARPLALATNLTPDQSAAIAAHPTYPDLFEEAFGDPSITARRIAFAIATYERTLIADQSPWDDFVAGNPNALTPGQQQGWTIFQTSRCDSCHTPPLFSDNQFRAIGVRPVEWDTGRMEVTGLFEDRGKFKTPGLRNSGLKPHFMHAGTFTTLNLAVGFYIGGPLFPENIDPFMDAVSLGAGQVPPLVDFIANGLTDPRVANETFPFDRPTLRSELPQNPMLIGPGSDNGSGFVPPMIAVTPPNLGNTGFKLGTTGMAEGTTVSLYVSSTPPAMGAITPERIEGPFTATTGIGAAASVTAHLPIPDNALLDGTTVYYQWVIDSTGARSPVAAATIFCGTGTCTTPCLADTNHDGLVTPADFSAWVAAFNASAPECDQNSDGTCTPADFSAWVANFNAGC